MKFSFRSAAREIVAKRFYLLVATAAFIAVGFIVTGTHDAIRNGLIAGSISAICAGVSGGVRRTSTRSGANP
jgi:hypothetical protein